jgi:2-keto-4-pentenoate hydratase
MRAAYAVQAEVTKRGIAAGQRLVGRKIGLTSKAVQQQLSVDQPDYGALFSDMEVTTGGEVQGSKLIQPRIEAEIAIVLDRDLSERDVTMGELMHAIAYVVPALEIVDSRIRDWKIELKVTGADVFVQLSASKFVKIYNSPDNYDAFHNLQLAQFEGKQWVGMGEMISLEDLKIVTE